MKVFISWSGKASKEAAIALKGWLPSVIQAIDPFVSSEDIRKGSRWFSEVGTKLEDYNFGILCLTPSNLNAPWILFEAGALSKKLGDALVTPLLLGLSNSDLEGPLAQFQTTLPHKEDIYRLISTMNKQHESKEILSNNILETSFNKWWPDIEKILILIDAHAKKEAEAEGVKSTRNTDEIMKEILDLSRSTVHQLNAIKEAQSYNSLSSNIWDSELNTREMHKERIKALNKAFNRPHTKTLDEIMNPSSAKAVNEILNSPGAKTLNEIINPSSAKALNEILNPPDAKADVNSERSE